MSSVIIRALFEVRVVDGGFSRVFMKRVFCCDDVIHGMHCILCCDYVYFV